MKNTRLAGHSLSHEGRIVVYNYLSNGPGPTQCECGASSPVLPTTAARKQWHREHKAEVAA